MAERSSWMPQGPREDDLLWYQPQHRSLHIYASDEQCERPLFIRRADAFFWETMREEIYRIPRVIRYIEEMGFGLVSTIGYMEYDHHLLTALAERWRPETHSFHLCIGEATITLEDVEVLLGLRTDGEAVTGRESYPSDGDMPGYLERLLGFVPERDTRTTIRLNSIKDHLIRHRRRVQISEEEALQRARCHVAILLAGCFFPDKSQNKIDLFLLQLLEDPKRCASLSWGSAVLAYTYRALCHAARSGETSANICGLLVQSWAWSRIRKVRPRFGPGYVEPQGAPFAAR
jgi:hypothetical protein